MSERPPQRLKWRQGLSGDGVPDAWHIVSACWGWTVCKMTGAEGDRFAAWRTHRDSEGRRPRDRYPELLGIKATGDEAKALAEWDAVRRAVK